MSVNRPPPDAPTLPPAGQAPPADSASATRPTVLTHIGRYRVERRLGARGQGAVQRAGRFGRRGAGGRAGAPRRAASRRASNRASVMIGEPAQPVVMDFGLAGSAQPLATLVTAAGDVLGTPAYMPPEQIEGDV